MCLLTDCNSRYEVIQFSISGHTILDMRSYNSRYEHIQKSLHEGRPKGDITKYNSEKAHLSNDNTKPIGVKYLKILDITSNLVNDEAKPSRLQKYE